MTSVLVEGGAEVLGSFLAARSSTRSRSSGRRSSWAAGAAAPAFGGRDPLEIADGAPPRARAREPAVPVAWPPHFELWRPRR